MSQIDVTLLDPSYPNHVIETRLEIAWRKRLAQVSQVIVLNTYDTHVISRAVEFFLRKEYEYCQQMRNELSKELPDAYEYMQGEVLYSIDVKKFINEGKIERNVVKRKTPLGEQPVREYEQVIQFLIDKVVNEDTFIAFLTVFTYLRSLEELVRVLALDYSKYKKCITLVIFTDKPSSVLPNSLNLTILIDNLLPNAEDRRKLIEERLKLLNVEYSSDVLNRIVNESAGLTMHEIESAMQEALLTYDLNIEAIPQVLSHYRREILKRSGLVLEEPKLSFADVAGFEKIKKLFTKVILPALRREEKALKLGVQPPRGILLFGPPGCGKTWLARALAGELKLPFVRFRASRIWDRYVGESEKNIDRLINLLESLAPCVLFIDEVDQLGVRSSIDTDSGTTRRVFSRLLEWLSEESNVLVIASTNRPDLLDPAFIRVGRFDYVIPILYPPLKTRLEILQYWAKKLNLPLAEDVNLEELAVMTELWNSAELRELLLRSARTALMNDHDKITREDVLETIQSFTINYEARKRELAQYLELMVQYMNDRSLLEDYEYLRKIEEKLRQT